MGLLNNTINPNEILVGSLKQIAWICQNGHHYKRSPYERINRNMNCPYCSNRKLLKGYNDIATTNPELLNNKNWQDVEKNK